MGHRVSAKDPAERPTGLPKKLIAAHGRYLQARSLWESGQKSESRKVCEGLVREYPTYAAPLHLLGKILLGRGEHLSALPYLASASAAAPSDAEIRIDLAHALGFAGPSDVALTMLGDAAAQDPESAAAHLAAGRIYEELYDYEAAKQSYGRAAELDPGDFSAALRLGELHVLMGENGSAADEFLRAHRLRPKAAGPLAGLAALPGDLVRHDLLHLIEAAMPGPGEKRRRTDALRLSFARATVLRKLGRHDECWAELLAASARVLERYGDKRASERRYRQRNLARAEALPALPASPVPPSVSKPVPLFILGPSRSGKSSLESLTTHFPGSRRGYESQIAVRSVRAALQAENLPPTGSLADMPAEFDDNFSAKFYELLRVDAQGAKLFTITTPGNIYLVDRLAGALPNARFVFVIRDKWDLGLEILLKWYSTGNGYSYDPAETLEYIETFCRLAAIWAARFPDRTLTLSYPDYLAKPEETLALVAKLIGADAPTTSPPPRYPPVGGAAPYMRWLAEVPKPADQV